MDNKRIEYSKKIAKALAPVSPALSRFHSTRAHKESHAIELTAGAFETPAQPSSNFYGLNASVSQSGTSSTLNNSDKELDKCRRCGTFYIPGVNCTVRTIRESAVKNLIKSEVVLNDEKQSTPSSDKKKKMSKKSKNNKITQEYTKKEKSSPILIYPFGKPNVSRQNGSVIWLKYICRPCGAWTLIPATEDKPNHPVIKKKSN